MVRSTLKKEDLKQDGGGKQMSNFLRQFSNKLVIAFRRTRASFEEELGFLFRRTRDPFQKKLGIVLFKHGESLKKNWRSFQEGLGRPSTFRDRLAL